jgi:hypothetical protein
MSLSCSCLKRECRPGRPLCRARRKASPRYRFACHCGAYKFPHRPDAGRCSPVVMNRLIHGEAPAAAAE